VLKERHRIFFSLLVALDTAVIVAAQAITLGVANDWDFQAFAIRQLLMQRPAAIMIAGIPLTVFCMAAFGLYRPRRDRMFLSEFFDLLKACATAWGILYIAIGLMREPFLRWDEANFFLVIYALVLIISISLYRYLFRLFLRLIRRRGWNLRHVAIIGTGRLAQITCNTFTRNSWTGINCAYFISHHDTTRRELCVNRPVCGGLDDLESVLKKRRVDGVIIALPQSRAHLLPDLLMRLEQFAVEVRIIPDVRPKYMPINLSVALLDGMPVLSVRQTPVNGYGAVFKRVLDLIIGSLALLFFSMPMLLFAVLIKLTSPGPILFRQQRVSIGSRPFEMYKFRTMRWEPVNETESENQDTTDQRGTDAWTKPNDPRITRLGAWLRKTSLDELPQLFNVLKGDMSLVGPRPERLDLIEHFREDWRGYMLRQNVKAGITGWAQINGLRGDTSLRKRLRYDLYYIRNWSILFDFRILFMTVFRGFRNPNAR